MKRYFLIVALLLIVPTGLVRAEQIENFKSQIDLASDGSFAVVEDITYDFGQIPKHGIFRLIKTTHPQAASAWYKKRYVDIVVDSVQIDGQPATYEVSHSSGEVSIKIGDADQTVTGLHNYTVAYQVHGALSYYEDGRVDLYWNVTGDEWEVPMNAAFAVVTAPANTLNSQQFCYVGAAGATDYCTEIRAASSSVTFVATGLSAGEGLTIAQALNPEQVDKLVLEETPTWWIWLIGLVLWFTVVIRFVYRYKTANRPDVPVISQYEPYADFKPMFSGVLIDGRLDSKDITAGIVYLAEQGFLTITKTSRKILLLIETPDYEVTLKRPINQAESRFLVTVLELLFDNDSTVDTTVSLVKLKTDRSKQRANYRAMQKLRKAIIDDLNERGFFERSITTPKLVGLIVLLILGLVFLAPVLASLVGPLTILIVLAVVVTAVIMGFMYQRRTKKGYEAMNHLKGFKEFLSVTDKDRFKFHNAPDKNPQTFMEYLPYAIAFGVEKEWAEVFKDIALPNPDWYQGNTGTTFSAVAFSQELGAFSSSFASSSGSSGTASSGGGFSGGGAGGGGGGSW